MNDSADQKSPLYAQGEMFADPNTPERHLNLDDAANLGAGAGHYRAYVGPPDRFDFMSGTQFALMFHLGLRDHHKVLDFGCGSLRLGKLLIPYLQSGRYFGIDPNQWLIDDGIKHELGEGIRAVKRPRFSDNADFNCDVFDEKFDMIMAQSIMTHTGPDLFDAFLASAKATLADDGIILFTYFPVTEVSPANPTNGWHYPHCVGYELAEINAQLRSNGLVGMVLPWYHQVTTWCCAAHDASYLPSETHLGHLTGAVLRSEQFADSVSSIEAGTRPAKKQRGVLEWLRR